MATTRIELPEATGMTLLAFAVLPDKPGCGVVIAQRDENDRSPDGFVTWSIFASRDEDDLWDNCQWGHYFDDAEYAWDDFVVRAKGLDLVTLRRPR